MDKATFVLLLIFSNIVPLLAWGSMAQRWPRKRVAESKVQTLRQRRPGPSYGRNYTVSDCKLKRGHCIYPLACLCPKPLQGGYYRAPPDEYHCTSAYSLAPVTDHQTWVGAKDPMRDYNGIKRPTTRLAGLPHHHT
ncbi:hypothetical protein MRX96_048150 [Rhipicephalus microplus]